MNSPHMQKSRRGAAAAAARLRDREEVSVLGRPGSDLLFQALRLSTIGAGEFNGRVRDGIGYRLPANTTRPAKDGCRRTDDGGQIRNPPVDRHPPASWSFISNIRRHPTSVFRRLSSVVRCALKMRDDQAHTSD